MTEHVGLTIFHAQDVHDGQSWNMIFCSNEYQICFCLTHETFSFSLMVNVSHGKDIVYLNPGQMNWELRDSAFKGQPNQPELQNIDPKMNIF